MLNHINMDVKRPGRGNILTFDLGTHCGWCSVGEDMSISSGTFHFPEVPHLPGRRFRNFYHSLISYRKGLMNSFGSRSILIGKILYEEVMFSDGHNEQGEQTGQSQRAAQLYGAWRGILLMFADTHGIPIEGVHNGTIKKFITGFGNASKADVVHMVGALGHDPKDDNEADAIALAYLEIAREQGVKEGTR